MARIHASFTTGHGQSLLDVSIDEHKQVWVGLRRNAAATKSIAFAGTHSERNPSRVCVLGDSLVVGHAHFASTPTSMRLIVDWLRGNGITVDIAEDAEVAA